MSRLVKTTTQVEGRVEERWALVDEHDELALWEPEHAEGFDVVGRPAPRADGLVRASGRARYTVDVRLPGMLHAAILRSPVAHGRVELDLAAARAVPGVRAVLGPDDDLGKGKPILHAEPLWVGAAVAVVAADTPELARAGVAALAATFAPLGFSVSMDEALAEQRFAGEPVEHERGDIEAALAAADVRVEVSLETPGHLQTALEPHAAVAEWRGDELTVWHSTQAMFDVRRGLARRFGLDQQAVRVIAEFIGGGFGAKTGAEPEAALAAALARAAGRPVRVVFDRHGEQLDGGRRPASRQTYRLGATADGTLTAIDMDALVQMGQEAWVPPIVLPALRLYRCASARAYAFPLRLNLRPANAFRAPGITEGVTGLESALDALAEALGIDPLELRRRNHATDDQVDGTPYSTKGLLACYDRAAELAGWVGRDALRGLGADGLLRGMGCASQVWWGSGNLPAHAQMRVGGDGVVRVTAGIQDIGTGTLTTARVVAAEALGLPLERIRVHGGDTAPNLYGPVAGGSLTTPSVMPAVRSAGAQLRRQILDLAGDVFEADPRDLELRAGRVTSRDGALDRDVDDVLGKLGNASLEAGGGRTPNPDGVAVYSFGCQIAQVAVDPGTGEVRVERIVAVHDVGRVLNPLTASSQVEGGVIQGLGYALLEEQVLDPTIGAPVNAGLVDYKLPTIADVPEIVIDFVELPDLAASNVGSKGLGEPPIIPTAGAIANAFAHATGVRPTALPLTPHRVLELLG